MVTVEQIISYIEESIARDGLAGDKDALRRTQYACSVLMQAAENSGDKATASRLRNLAASAANRRDKDE